MNIGVILAGGIGSRLGNEYPKQLMKVAGKTIIEHTIDVFEKNTNIDEICVVINPGYINEIENFVIKNKWNKVSKILKGGTERYQSSLIAIESYINYPKSNIIFHDSVRPLLNQRIINECVKELKKYNAIDVAIPATDTIIETSLDNQFITSVPDRKRLYRGQTPQGFKLKTIYEAYKKGLTDPNFKATDDCGVVMKYLPKEKIKIIKGDESNIKLTYKEDLFLLDKLFQLRTTTIENINLDKANEKVIVVFGGNSGIGEKIAEISKNYGAKTYTFSRSLNNVDISKIDDIKKALNQVFEKEGKIDYVVNSAAILTKKPLISLSQESINSSININLIGAINVAKESFEYLQKTKGQLLLFTSSSYTRGRSLYSLYSASKAACVNFTQAISEEWDQFDIRINIINPERTNTPMRTKNFGNEPPESLLTSEKVAIKSIQTLLSNISGQVIDVRL